MSLHRYDTPEAVAAAVADAFIADARAAIAQRGAFYVALAGGSTPKAAYALLAAPPRRSAIDWSRVHVFFSDERCVPPESADSNYRMAADALLDSVPLPPGNVQRMRGEMDPGQAAAAYAALIRAIPGEPPAFDLIMLGMGADGHTASLFPGSDPFAGDDSLVRAIYVEKLQTFRITFTPMLINAARRVLIATEGAAKAAALHAVLDGPYEPAVYPVQSVKPQNGELSWYVDRAAAAGLCDA